jgi:2-(1,2-epoxy-1,2-dihydrophenyl)acetyl-CoA isomerase
MDYETILYDLTSNVATITLNRPEFLNALTGQMRLDIGHALRRAEGDARVLVLTGAGRAFCSGQDLGQRDSVADIDIQRMLLEEYHPLVESLAGCAIPTIAAVNGAAAGAGASLALACDVVIAAESAYFLQAFARIGLVPDAGGTWFLPRAVGLPRALGAALFAEKITAAQAHSWGMIWEVVPDAGFSDHVAGRAVTLARGPTRAYGLIKTLMRGSLNHGLTDQLEIEAAAQGEASRSQDHLEGLAAFAEKRTPAFKGR